MAGGGGGAGGGPLGDGDAVLRRLEAYSRGIAHAVCACLCLCACVSSCVRELVRACVRAYLGVRVCVRVFVQCGSRPARAASRTRSVRMCACVRLCVSVSVSLCLCVYADGACPFASMRAVVYEHACKFRKGCSGFFSISAYKHTREETRLHRYGSEGCDIRRLESGSEKQFIISFHQFRIV